MKILYNVTVNVDHDVHAEWFEWMKNTHIPDVMRTGLFLEYRMCRLIGDEDSGGVTYSIQYILKDMETYENYAANHAPALQADVAARYKDKFVAFRTLLEVID